MSNFPRTIFDLNLSTRSRNCLSTITTDLRTLCTKHTWDEVRWIRQFGKTCQRELLRKLEEYGLAIGMSEADYDAAAGLTPSPASQTLRDQFAMAALATIRVANYTSTTWSDLIAITAYKLADAMLRERAKESDK